MKPSPKKRVFPRRFVRRKILAVVLSSALVASALLLVFSRERNFLDRFERAREQFDFLNLFRKKPAVGDEKFPGGIGGSAPLRLPEIPGKISPARGGGLFEITSGDIIGLNAGGREFHPDGSTVYGEDSRAWFDARFPLLDSSALSLYGAGTIGFDTARIGTAQDAFSRENISLGGGFGISLRISENAEILFDYRLSRPLDSESLFDTNNAAGFSLKLSF